MERWEALTPAQRKKFLPLCPDFSVELVSETDDVEETRSKMQEYINNGLRLGWLINSRTRQVEIYRPNQAVEVLQYMNLRVLQIATTKTNFKKRQSQTLKHILYTYGLSDTNVHSNTLIGAF
jgi:Uma2 family endonuclease